MRKLRKFVYDNTKGRDDIGRISDSGSLGVGGKHSILCVAIHKLRHGNLNNSMSGENISRKFETALQRIEKVGSFTINYEQAMHTKIPIDSPKKTICEIMPGFLKDNNLRIVYEALRVSFF